MAGTFSQIYIQAIFAVKGRQNILQMPWRCEVFKYIAGIIKNKGQKSIIVNGVDDHIHVFLGLKPSMPISDLFREVKNNSTNFINERKFIKGRFHGRRAMELFHTHSQIKSVHNYILDQEKHHTKKTFQEEYMDFLRKFEIPNEKKYLFKWIE